MKWDYWITLYVQTHCTARGLRTSSITAYQATLKGFREYVREHWPEHGPEQITARDVLEYLDYLRRERANGASAINRQVTVLRNFYRAIVAMGHLEPRDNPLAHFPKVKAARRKLPLILKEADVRRLIERPDTDTVLGLRDRAIMTILYGTGIRASECAGLTEGDIDWQANTIHVVGKGGHERSVPLNEEVAHMLKGGEVGGSILPEP
jgi:site-specific recombinase XerD